jgi:hypothetical protein
MEVDAVLGYPGAHASEKYKRKSIGTMDTSTSVAQNIKNRTAIVIGTGAILAANALPL